MRLTGLLQDMCLCERLFESEVCVTLVKHLHYRYFVLTHGDVHLQIYTLTTDQVIKR